MVGLIKEFIHVLRKCTKITNIIKKIIVDLRVNYLLHKAHFKRIYDININKGGVESTALELSVAKVISWDDKQSVKFIANR